jgi:hypothetical protein
MRSTNPRGPARVDWRVRWIRLDPGSAGSLRRDRWADTLPVARILPKRSGPTSRGCFSVGMKDSWVRTGARIFALLAIFVGVGSSALAQTGATNAPPAPSGSKPSTPASSGPARASDWLPGSPAAADSAAADTLQPKTLVPVPGGNPVSGASESIAPPSEPTGSQPGVADSLADSARASKARAQADLPPSPPTPDRFLRLPPNTGTGISIGYPSYPGLFIVAPADGPLAFRAGLTGFPTIGLLWTPGLEYRFGQERGTLSLDGVYAFGNAFLGRSYWDGDQHEYVGAEAGLGFRWLIDDRRGVRWIAAVEAGGYWRGDPVRPRRLSLRFIWTLVE